MIEQPRRTICVFGEALVDAFEEQTIVGGAPLNVARHLAAFGDNPTLVTAIGRDAYGEDICAELNRFGMTHDGVQVLPECKTGFVRVVMNQDRTHAFEIERNCAYDHIGVEALRALDPLGCFYYGTLALRSQTSRETWQLLLNHHRGLRFFDLNWRQGHVDPDQVLLALAQADIVKVNEEELDLLLSWCRLSPTGWDRWTIGQVDPSVQDLVRQYMLERIVVTCGDRGFVVFNERGECTHASRLTRQIKLVDTVGAGDAFSAVILHGICRNWDFATSLARACDFASHICEISGAVPKEQSQYKIWTTGWA